ncbi:TIGR03960 family B12-binding radical SAM protein [Fidelibacter multiformis]|uniref:TIGR03960 family B12-binding radical SAM protein n=1 Tax=Fidelibacter multiformis TaxID=3377529 RepID=UPI0037DD1166
METLNANILHDLLTRVEKPGRYVGGELNMIRKNPGETNLSLCLAYPDTYEVGMPFQGFQELYHLVNAHPHYAAERVYAPWTDMERVMREKEIPLFSLENQRPLADFDVLGFTLQYEMTYTNILNMMDLAGIPLFSRDRNEKFPLMIAGGSCAYNPEPLASFMDLFVIGDAEDLVIPLMDLILEGKKQGWSREYLLETLAGSDPAFYVPSVWDRKPYPIRRHIVKELRPEYYPEKPLIPLIEIAHDRFALEIQRGCTEGCRFCQAGMTYRPVRERAPEDLYQQTVQTLRNTGYEEMSLLSLSTSDYTGLEPAIRKMLPVIRSCHVSVSFPSLRLDSVNPELLDAALSGKRSGLTFAPEAGTERLRRVINKNIRDKQLFDAFLLALEKGWKTVKFYFMVGLPTETPEDLDGIVRLIRTLHDMSRPYGYIHINVTLSSFIPKPATPFQWEAQADPATLQARIDHVKQKLRIPGIKVMTRDPEYTLIEGILARGDRQVGDAIYRSWRKGSRFDAWSEYFDMDRWMEAFEESGISAETYLTPFDTQTLLPWEHISPGVSLTYLLKEKEKAYREEYTQDCRDGCTGCDVCDFTEIRMRTVDSGTVRTFTKAEDPIPFQPLPEPSSERYITRLEFSKTGLMRYLSHQDLFRLIHRSLNFLRLPVRFSEGFNPRPRISLGYPIPMGFEALSEYADITFNTPVDGLREKLNSIFPPGLRILKTQDVSKDTPSVMQATCYLDYEALFQEKVPIQKIKQTLDELAGMDQWLITRHHPKKGNKTIDLKPLVDNFTINETRPSIFVRFRVQETRTGRLDEFLHIIFKKEDLPPYEGRRLKAGLCTDETTDIKM